MLKKQAQFPGNRCQSVEPGAQARTGCGFVSFRCNGFDRLCGHILLDNTSQLTHGKGFEVISNGYRLPAKVVAIMASDLASKIATCPLLWLV